MRIPGLIACLAVAVLLGGLAACQADQATAAPQVPVLLPQQLPPPDPGPGNEESNDVTWEFTGGYSGFDWPSADRAQSFHVDQVFSGGLLYTNVVFPTSPEMPFGIWGNQITSAAGLVLVPEYELWALSPTDGSVRWHFGGSDGSAGVNTPAISGDTLFLGSVLGWASAVDARTGEALWSVDLGEAPFGPTLGADLVIYGTRGFLGPDRGGPLGAGHVVALRRGTGEVAWTFPLPDSADFPGSGGAVKGGVVWQDRLIVGSMASRLYALRLSDGALLWEHVGADPPRAPYEARPAVLGATVMALRADGVLEGIDVASGEQRWTIPHGAGPSDPLVTDSLVYVAAGPLRAVEANGHVRWEWGGLPTGGPFFAVRSPALDSTGIFFLGGGENNRPETFLYAVRPF
jgi:outer membrane protein assembly factor BamB